MNRTPKQAQELSVQADTRSQPVGSEVTFDHLLLNASDNRLSLPAWWSPARDFVLRRYVRGSTILSGIMYQRISHFKNLSWTLVADDERMEPLIPVYTDMIQNSQFGDGFRSLIELFTQDVLGQDNGGFVELIGEDTPTEYDNRYNVLGRLPKDEIVGFSHLDAAQMWRTNNFEYPYIYTNAWTGQQTIMHWSRIAGVSQMTQPIERGRGIGLSAVSRAWAAVEGIDAVNNYYFEKVVGQSPEIGLVSGLQVRAIEAALSDNAIETDNQGLTFYKGIAFVETDAIQGVTPSVEMIGVKSVPESFDRETEFTLGLYMVAMAFATDVRDLGYSVGATGATKGDAEIQDMKTSNRGRADLKHDIEDILTRRILPVGLKFEFDAKDDIEDKRKAEIEQLRASTRSIRLLSGEIDINEAREIAVRDGDMDVDLVANVEMGSELGGEEGGEKAFSQKVEYAPLRRQFSRRLFTALNRYRRTNDYSSFFVDFTDLVTNYGKRAFLAGVQDGGAPDVRSVGRLEADERAAMNNAVNEQIGYVGNMVVGDATVNFASIRQRVLLWSNKGLDGIYNQGLIHGRNNPNMIWELGATEKHCTDCLKYSGRVYRKRTWEKHDIYPRHSHLECGGFQCDCTIEVTEKASNKGKPPKMSGGKVYIETIVSEAMQPVASLKSESGGYSFALPEPAHALGNGNGKSHR